jgi:hypothetical protein
MDVFAGHEFLVLRSSFGVMPNQELPHVSELAVFQGLGCLSGSSKLDYQSLVKRVMPGLTILAYAYTVALVLLYLVHDFIERVRGREIYFVSVISLHKRKLIITNVKLLK